MSTKNTPPTHTAPDRLDRISTGSQDSNRQYKSGYSAFIRWAKLVLPIVGACIIAIIFTWNDTPEQYQKIEHSTNLSGAGRNELLNPKFESKDKKDQPFTINAERAVRSKDEENLIMLDQPLADIELNSGAWLAIKSKQGAYRHDTQRLVLNGDVEAFHDQGYQLNTQSLHIDMENELFWSDVPVQATGPDGILEGSAMTANQNTQIIKTLGPAKLTLIKAVDMKEPF